MIFCPVGHIQHLWDVGCGNISVTINTEESNDQQFDKFAHLCYFTMGYSLRITIFVRFYRIFSMPNKRPMSNDGSQMKIAKI